MLWGRQHHTLDMELFGPNSWLTSMYLAALKAAAEMAEAVGESDFGGECAALAKKGGAYVDGDLFNGRYYAQKLDLADRSVLEPFDTGPQGRRLAGLVHAGLLVGGIRQIKYQIGGGCLTDQILGQWHADLAGLGDLFRPDNVVSALAVDLSREFPPEAQRPFQPVPRLRL